jgi:DNA polymerase-3 subunit delta'
MSLAKIPGQERAKRFLKELTRTGHIPHALLFSGMAGIGKMAVAREFAKVLNCLSPKDFDCCDECASCRKMDSGNHPDLVWVASEGTFIKLDQIRSLKERMRFRPFEGRWRVTVLQDAQDLKEEAGNALLKLLEEPPKQNIFLLTVLEPQMLLSTIVSRCCHVRFQPLDDYLIEDHLVHVCNVPPGEAGEIARLAEGSLQRAQWLIEEDRIAHWKDILGKISRLSELRMIDFFPFMSQWAQKSDDLEQDLECIKLWVRDLILSRLTTDYRPVIQTDVEAMERLRGIPMENLFRIHREIEEALQNLRQNANKQLTLEGLCLAIKDGLYGQGSWNSFSQGG